ncbi:polysaccharide export protein [bacterium]|jgi:polysaccharide export outer membrane protein|nr:polysaccharide export protein [bacterium]
MRFSSFSAHFNLSALVWLCILLPLGATEATNPATAPSAPAAPVDYVLRPADILQVKIYKEEDLTREVSVSQEYTVSLPLIGNVSVKNRSVRQIEEMIRQLYERDFLVNPQVTLIVLKYAERAVNVIGSVNAPQAVPFPPERGLTLLEAVARAGGFSRLADRSKVKIIRTDEKGVSTTFTINADKLMESRSVNLWALQVDDVIQVEERIF